MDPGFRSKVVAMEGDILEPCLALSDDNLDTLQKEASIVFHSAATVKFDEKLGYVKFDFPSSQPYSMCFTGQPCSEDECVGFKASVASVSQDGTTGMHGAYFHCIRQL